MSFAADTEIELVSVSGECREATVWFGELKGDAPYRATVLPGGESIAGDPMVHLLARALGSIGIEGHIQPVANVTDNNFRIGGQLLVVNGLDRLRPEHPPKDRQADHVVDHPAPGIFDDRKRA